MPVYKKVNKKFFKTWTSEMAYVLGFFAADGTITINLHGTQYFVLQIADKNLLESIREVLNSEHKISRRVHKKDHSIFYRLQIGSRDMCGDLNNLGFGERKAKRMRLPKIPDRYFQHFLRGYFDGDGNVWIGFVHKDRTKQTYVIHTAFTSASKGFLEDLFVFLKYNGVQRGCLSKRKGNEAYSLKFSINDSMLLYHLMYDNLGNNLFLERKKDRFETFLKTRNRK